MKTEKLQLIPQKYKVSYETTTSNYANKMDNLEEMNKFLARYKILATYNLPRLTKVENMNRPITIETDFKSSKKIKVQDQMASQVNSIKCLEKS